MAAAEPFLDLQPATYPAPTADYDQPSTDVATLPGQATDCGEAECGNVTGAEACPKAQHDPDNHHRRKFYQTCEGRTCATGYEDWIKDRAKRLTDRLIGGIQAHRKHGANLGPVKHVIFSPPEASHDDYRGPDGYSALLRDAYTHAREAGMDGGVAIPHLWRLRDDLTAHLREQGYGVGEDAGGLWQGVHDDALNAGTWKAYVEFSPHVHILGTGWLENANDFHNRTGWIYKNKGTRNHTRATARYILSHASLIPNQRAQRWWGAFAYNNLAREAILTTREEKTCDCGETIYEYPTSTDGAIGWAYRGMPAERVEKTAVFRLVGKPPPEGLGC